jgi:putative transposase
LARPLAIFGRPAGTGSAPVTAARGRDQAGSGGTGLFRGVNKRYRPQNKRLEGELYQQTGRVTFPTICALRPAGAFSNNSMNHAVIEILRALQSDYPCQVHTYCLMPDHLHFLITPQLDGISVLTFCDRFKSLTTRRSWELNWKGRLWQKRSYDHIVRAEEDLYALAVYILNNPVRRGLCASPDKWPWSGHMNPLP